MSLVELSSLFWLALTFQWEFKFSGSFNITGVGEKLDFVCAFVCRVGRHGKKTDILDMLKLRRTNKQTSFALATNLIDNKKLMIPTSVAWLSCRVPKDFPRESQKFFEVSTSRSLISLSAPSRTYLKSQKTRSRKRLPEESGTRSNVKIVIMFALVRDHAQHWMKTLCRPNIIYFTVTK